MLLALSAGGDWRAPTLGAGPVLPAWRGAAWIGSLSKEGLKKCNVLITKGEVYIKFSV